jgi:hypothetical protein
MYVTYYQGDLSLFGEFIGTPSLVQTVTYILTESLVVLAVSKRRKSVSNKRSKYQECLL